MKFIHPRFLLFCFVTLFVSLAFSQHRVIRAQNETPTPKWQLQIDEIDKEISRKTDQKNLYRAKAARAQDQGDRLQFDAGTLTEARKYWQIADAYREQIKLLDLEIELLKYQRGEILKENHITNY